MVITSKTYFGGALEVNLSANFTIQPRMKRLLRFFPTTSGLTVTLASARQHRKGGVIAWVVNEGPDSIVLRNASLTTLATLTAGQVAEVLCLDNLTTAGVWHVQVSTVGSAANPAPNQYHYIAQGRFDPSGVDLFRKTFEYNQQLDAVTTKTDSPSIGTQQQNCAGFKATAAMHMTGGSTGSTGQPDNISYDPDVWSTHADMPLNFKTHAGAHIGADGFIFGGIGTGGDTSSNRRRVQAYSSGSWSTGTSRPTGRETKETSAKTASNGKIYLTAGYNTAGNSNINDEFFSNTWTVKMGRPFPEYNWTGTAAASQFIFMFAGAFGSAHNPAYDFTMRYDVTLDSWTTMTNYPDGPSFHLAASSVGNNIQIMGGEIGGTSSDATEHNWKYDHVLDAYSAKANLPGPLKDAMNHSQGLPI